MTLNRLKEHLKGLNMKDRWIVGGDWNATPNTITTQLADITPNIYVGEINFGGSRVTNILKSNNRIIDFFVSNDSNLFDKQKAYTYNISDHLPIYTNLNIISSIETPKGIIKVDRVKLAKYKKQEIVNSNEFENNTNFKEAVTNTLKEVKIMREHKAVIKTPYIDRSLKKLVKEKRGIIKSKKKKKVLMMS